MKKYSPRCQVIMTRMKKSYGDTMKRLGGFLVRLGRAGWSSVGADSGTGGGVFMVTLAGTLSPWVLWPLGQCVFRWVALPYMVMSDEGKC